MSCLTLSWTQPLTTLHFKWILITVLKFKILSLVYTPEESAWIALVGL